MAEQATIVSATAPSGMSIDRAELDGYAKDVSFVNRVRPVSVVRPKTASDVQQIVKFANETRTPLVPVSSGPPHFRGDTVPSVGGAVIVDLSAMKKVMFVDRKRRVAMCEPGVTFGELIPLAEKEGLRLNMPLLPRQSKSVVGSILEREPVVMPKYQWDISDPLACAGIVLGTGDDWDRAAGRALGPNQNMVHEWLDKGTGDSYWVQSWNHPVDKTGTAIGLSDLAPLFDRWNFAAVEIVK